VDKFFAPFLVSQFSLGSSWRMLPHSLGKNTSGNLGLASN
jgi:hypothetical protein